MRLKFICRLYFIRFLKFPGRPVLPGHLEMVAIITNEKKALKNFKKPKIHVFVVRRVKPEDSLRLLQCN